VPTACSVERSLKRLSASWPSGCVCVSGDQLCNFRHALVDLGEDKNCGCPDEGGLMGGQLASEMS
jgi:hypothetical protein